MSDAPLAIRLNGERRSVAAGTTLRALLADLGLASSRVAVEVNLDVVPKKDFESRTLAEGDAVEIVSFVGGG